MAFINNDSYGISAVNVKNNQPPNQNKGNHNNKPRILKKNDTANLEENDFIKYQQTEIEGENHQ